MNFFPSRYQPIRDSVGETTNPGSGAIMADTAALPGGIYQVIAISSATATAEFSLQRRNAANSATIGDVHIWYVPANNTVALPFIVDVEKDERIRIVMNAALTGDAVASVIVQRIA